MENKYWEILKELNLFSDVTPINSNEEKYSFFKSLTEGKKYEPQFVYDKRDLSGLEKLKTGLQKKRILLLNNRVPFPVKDGGALATHSIIDSFNNLGFVSFH